ncbi:hypothetical protein McpSp1_01050 [Methanocorpusculaceae archaeon Sp1]|nr:hypothetical protein [Methanocorpusculaceae archaeon Sp1]
MQLKTVIRVDWDDLDAYGHVNNLIILRYVQTSRIHLCEEVGLMKGSTRPAHAPILAATSCRYCKPLYYPGTVTVDSVVTEVKNTSFLISHSIYDSDANLIATAEDVLVYFDYENECKTPIPDDLRERLLRFCSTETK